MSSDKLPIYEKPPGTATPMELGSTTHSKTAEQLELLLCRTGHICDAKLWDQHLRAFIKFLRVAWTLWSSNATSLPRYLKTSTCSSFSSLRWDPVGEPQWIPPWPCAEFFLPPDPGTIVSHHGRWGIASASPGAHNARILTGTHPWVNEPSCRGACQNHKISSDGMDKIIQNISISKVFWISE